MRRTGRIKGVHRKVYTLADGSRAEYHRVRGMKNSTFWKTGDDCVPGDEEYERRFNEMRKGAKAKQDAEESKQPGATFEKIVRAYLRSPEFKAKAPRTQRDYEKWAERIIQRFGDAPKEVFEDPEIRSHAFEWRDQWDGKQSQYAWTVLRLIVSWAYDRGRLKQHHLRGGGQVYKANRAEIVWLPQHQERFNEVAPEWVRRILTAALETGLRVGDLCRLSWSHVERTPAGRRIKIRTGKGRGARVAEIPVTPAMGALLDETPKDRMQILVSDRGLPLTTHRASEAVKQWKRKAGLPEELRLNDCRGTTATRLLRAGATLAQIAKCMGWSLRYAQNVIETYATSAPDESDKVLELLETAKTVEAVR